MNVNSPEYKSIYYNFDVLINHYKNGPKRQRVLIKGLYKNFQLPEEVILFRKRKIKKRALHANGWEQSGFALMTGIFSAIAYSAIIALVNGLSAGINQIKIHSVDSPPSLPPLCALG